jgi:F0F1-type ATP synthase membrane subunit c/vacuolar-type H+-ATPase subunit K
MLHDATFVLCLDLNAAGSGDGFLEGQLQPEAFQAACHDAHMQHMQHFIFFILFFFSYATAVLCFNLDAAGSGGGFLEVQLKPEAFQAAAHPPVVIKLLQVQLLVQSRSAMQC